MDELDVDVLVEVLDVVVELEVVDDEVVEDDVVELEVEVDVLDVLVVELVVVDVLEVEVLELLLVLVEVDEELVVVKLKFVTSICPNVNSDILLEFYDSDFRTVVCITCFGNSPTIYNKCITYWDYLHRISWDYNLRSCITCW